MWSQPIPTRPMLCSWLLCIVAGSTAPAQESVDGVQPTASTVNAGRYTARMPRDTEPYVGRLPAPQPADTLDSLHSPLLEGRFQIQGAASCASAACHGGPRPGVAQPTVERSAEYPLWLENDPHALSWRTLSGDESVAIMRRLEILDDAGHIADRAGFDNCLACHNTSGLRRGGANSVAHREGVGCEACHGPAEQWIATHFRFRRPQPTSHDGFINVADLYTRARVCASCHVGDRDRDMNHDIIAAGHPTLRFEMATFHAWQPKHWRDREAADRTFYEAQLWLAGQVAAADASLALLQGRASGGLSVSQWPELSAYACASCHQRLGLRGISRAEGDGDPEHAALATYSRWHSAGLRWLIQYRSEQGQSTPEDLELWDSLDQVRHLMQAAARPDADAVGEASANAREALAAWLRGAAGSTERQIFRSGRLGRVVASAAGEPATMQSWESAAQFYLAAVAARESWPGGWRGPLHPLASRMRNGLRYPEQIDISRYGHRTTSRAPTATRAEMTRLAIELAGWLGPVNPDPALAAAAVSDREEDPVNLQRQIDRLLEEISERWRRGRRQPESPAPRRDRPADDAELPADQPLPEQADDAEPPRQTLEELRKALEQLQNGNGNATDREDGEN